MDDVTEDAIDDVLEIITEFYGVSLEDVLSPRRSAQVHTARCVGIYLAHKAGADPHEIGERFRRNHAIIAVVCRNMSHKVSTDYHHRRLIRDLDVIRSLATRRRDRLNVRWLH